MNLWHDITIGKNSPEEFNCIIEIPKGSHNKYEIDKETGLIKLDRANYGPAAYPFDYGFVPQTLWEDGDALDVILLSTFPVNTGVLVNARPVALLEMTDSGESDYKIIAVPVEDRRWEDVKDLADLNNHSLREFQNFFETIKQLKGKPAVVEIHGYKGKAEAIEAIEKAQKLYSEKFGK
ncbi:inorganic diphosphatase [Candidatus Nomurabacteria bacterium]|nr:inorganic diphosphatase [Candidatus Nomurabacteria bacterium]